ncbi:hypothetical protein BSR29_07920 [Boudabousia liubingyangii]|uniref:ClC family H(+)/Cl(-) exchange transporter n=1 Tax=Boudabousia liubingyangii TaxID=1921764 RepID=A0A1Q5PJT5_9ACTO|nr:ClC family H(+)/Cl(-) exchange transporter [Boudabousia liubingyangii]OKL46169.1 hypothetical protein BSR29_07920 [Boudabousia liubingyangii]OKL46318.1 hypothetical protein BSR28_07215 [Boudabousia liubingyangii]
MKHIHRPSPESISLVVLTIVSSLVGLLTGAVAATFRLCLHWAAEFRLWFHEGMSSKDNLGFVLYLITVVVAVIVAAELVKRIEPAAEGSGIPRVEAIVAGHMKPGRSRILPVKFSGGVLAIGSGMMLGREGPLVQMGGNIAITINKLLHLDKDDLRVIIGAGAAAGLATAFNAPIAGGVFILEELVKRFDVRTSLATLSASAAGFLTSIVIVGDDTDFRMGQLPTPDLGDIHWTILVGLICGLMGIAYNWYVMFCLHVADRAKLPISVRAGAIALVIGLLGWFHPDLVGGGDNLTQEALFAHGDLYIALSILVIRFVLGPICYAAGTPGGLFAPMLVIGTTTGELIGFIAEKYDWLGGHPPIHGMAIVGMAAFFTATVRAPVTGLILATEMTGTTTMLPPMLGACAVAMLVASAAHCEPIYDQLARRSEQRERFQPVFDAVSSLPRAAKRMSTGITKFTASGRRVNRTNAPHTGAKNRAQKLRKEQKED